MISTVTVNYKTEEYVERMLDSLFDKHDLENGEEIEVFVVENGSGDDFSDLEEKFPRVNFLYNERNEGFAAGCNTAIEKASGDFVALINPDIIFTEDALYKMADRMREDEDVGVGGVSLKNLDGSRQLCVRRFPTPFDQIVLLSKLPHLVSDLKVMKRWRMSDFDYSRTSDVDQVMGAFFFIRREAMNDIGLLDDGFFIWYEEVDFCKRAKDAGWRVRYYHDVSAKHKKGSSFEKVMTVKKQNMLRNSLRRYMKKHYGIGWWMVFCVLEPVFFSLSVLAGLIKPR